MTALSWGRRFLMCRPDNFDVFYEINPWMHAEVKPDEDRAISEFEGLVTALVAAGAAVEFQPSVPGLPDLVFTANAGIVNGDQFVPSAFRHPERQGETPCDEEWFSSRGFSVSHLPAGVCHEGAGDALPFEALERKGSATGVVLVSGYRFRSDFAAHALLSHLIGTPVRSVELVDERLYHLDLTFCPLDDRRAMIAPMGLDSYGLAVLKELVPEALMLEDEEAEKFVANSVVVGSNIIMPSCPPRVGRILEGWGFDIAVAPVGEFLKAGGGCRCLTLALDVVLGESAPLPGTSGMPRTSGTDSGTSGAESGTSGAGSAVS